MSKSKRAQRRAYVHGEPAPSMNVAMIGGVFALLIIGALAGVIVLMLAGGGIGVRTVASQPGQQSPIDQSQAQAIATATAATALNNQVPRVDLATAKALYDQKAAVIVDARNLSQYQQAHIAGALSVPLVDFDSRKSALPADKNAQIIVYCA